MNRDASTKNAYRSQTWSRLGRKICACVSRNTQNQNRQSWRGNLMACQNSKRHSWRQEAEHTRESPQPEIEGKCWSQKKSRLKTASLYEPVSTLVLQLRCLLWHCAIPWNVSFHVKISCRFPYRLAKGYACVQTWATFLMSSRKGMKNKKSPRKPKYGGLQPPSEDPPGPKLKLKSWSNMKTHKPTLPSASETTWQNERLKSSSNNMIMWHPVWCLAQSTPV